LEATGTADAMKDENNANEAALSLWSRLWADCLTAWKDESI
jgi:hypothetical protein